MHAGVAVSLAGPNYGPGLATQPSEEQMSPMLDAVSRILGRCDSEETVLPPTELFNEGWMLRLVLDWLDRNRKVLHPLALTPDAGWYSEALLPSRFLPESRGDPKGESFTHADGVIGHFDVASGDRGDVQLLSGARQFVVVEAKLGSALSARTKHAPTYDQAARNVACMAYVLGSAGIEARAVDRLAFYVVAPETQVKSGLFADLVTKPSVERKVRERGSAYGGKHDGWFKDTFLPTLSHIELGTLSWEDVLDSLPRTAETQLLSDFYAQCLRFNPLRAGRAA